MLSMYAEVRQGGEWRKVSNYFVSSYEELDGALGDRVYDGYDPDLNNFLVEQSASGMPEDASDEIRANKYLKNEDKVYNATLRELLGFDWNREKYKEGYISDWQYKTMALKGDEPLHIRKTLPAEALVIPPFVVDMFDKRSEVIYVYYKYGVHNFYEDCEFFCQTSIPALIKLIPVDGSVDDVRVIFSI